MKSLIHLPTFYIIAKFGITKINSLILDHEIKIDESAEVLAVYNNT